MLAVEHDDCELVCDSIRYVEPVQLDVQQPRQAPVELVGTGKDASSSVEHSLKCAFHTFDTVDWISEAGRMACNLVTFLLRL